MQVSKLSVTNIGIIEDISINIDKPEIVFYGEIKQGKSTILNAVRWVCGGAFPADIIRHGQPEASVQLEGTEGDGKPWVIRREWYTAKDGAAKAREITYTRNGVPVKKPVDAIKTHLNPFLLDQDYLRNMTTLERGRYLTELFGVDTSAEDGTIAEADRQASQLRIKVKMYGALDLTPVERVDVAKLKSVRAGIMSEHAAKVSDARQTIQRMQDAHATACAKVDTFNAKGRADNAEVDRITAGCNSLTETIASLERQIAEAKDKLNKGTAWLLKNKKVEETPRPACPDVSKYQDIADTAADTTEVDAAIQQAGAQNVMADNYAAAKAKAADKAKDEKAILAQEKIARDAKASKVAKLAAVGKETGIKGLAFKDGGFEFDGADSSMLSDSQIMRLSEALSAKYPEGFGLSMIDRGESLGKSVLTLWEEAQTRKATVLVTVVGDKPAKVPEQVGAYVVEKGKVTK